METLHGVTNPAKVLKIVESIERDGWQGAPMVADGDLLLTGVHRYAALRMLDRAMEVEEHTIDIRNICPDYDARVAELIAEDFDGMEAIQITLEGLPVAIHNEYGIDLH
mgnify:CR=1 FL=1